MSTLERRIGRLETRHARGMVAGPIPIIDLGLWPAAARAELAVLRAIGDLDAEDALIERYAGVRLPPPGTGYVRCIFDYPPAEGSGAA